MIALQPDLEQIAEAAIFCDVSRREMIVVIQNWFSLGELMIQPACGLGVQQEIFVDEFHGQNGSSQTTRDSLFIGINLTRLPVGVSTRICSLA